MKILVIGGTHFIGAYLTKELLGQGHEVVLLNRGKQTPFFEFDIETIHSDKRDIASKRLEIKHRRFDLAIDMVAMNISDTQPVLDLLEGMIERICIISSADVYRIFDVIWCLDPSSVDNTALKEGSPLRRRLFPRNLIYEGEELNEMYDKIPVECLAQKLDKSSWTICRLPAVYGAGDYRFPGFVKRLSDRRNKWVIERSQANFRFTHGYVEDVVKAIALAAINEKGRNEVFNIGELETPTFRERYNQIAQTFDFDLEIFEADKTDITWFKEAHDYNLDQHWILNSNKIREQLGFRETFGSEDAYRKTIEWELQNLSDPINPDEFDYDSEDGYIELRSK